MTGEVSDGVALLSNGIRVPLTGHLSGLANGKYRFGARAAHLSLVRTSSDDVQIDATAELAEMSGSETFIHIAYGDTSWVVQEEGVCSVGLGEETRVFLETRHLYVFDGGGTLVAAPARG